MNSIRACHQHKKKEVGVFLFIERYERKRGKGTDVYMLCIHRDENEQKRKGKKGNSSKKYTSRIRVHHHH
jgi:hypothetical protein